MSIDRINSRGGSGPEPTRVPRSANAKAPDRPSASDGAAATEADQVELSAAVRSLAGHDVPIGTLAPARLREVVDRLSSDFYDGAAVRDVIARRLLADLGITFKER